LVDLFGGEVAPFRFLFLNRQQETRARDIKENPRNDKQAGKDEFVYASMDN